MASSTRHLRPGNQAALLSHTKTLDLYRANAKKTNDPEVIFEFAVFMIDASKNLSSADNGENEVQLEEKRDDLIKEATVLLKRLADRGHPDAQYFLADCYANGIGTVRGKQDFDRAFPLFILAAKHGHPDAAYRAGTCCENGWGCRRESAKAVMFYKSVTISALSLDVCRWPLVHARYAGPTQQLHPEGVVAGRPSREGALPFRVSSRADLIPFVPVLQSPASGKPRLLFTRERCTVWVRPS